MYMMTGLGKHSLSTEPGYFPKRRKEQAEGFIFDGEEQAVQIQITDQLEEHEIALQQETEEVEFNLSEELKDLEFMGLILNPNSSNNSLAAEKVAEEVQIQEERLVEQVQEQVEIQEKDQGIELTDKDRVIKDIKEKGLHEYIKECKDKNLSPVPLLKMFGISFTDMLNVEEKEIGWQLFETSLKYQKRQKRCKLSNINTFVDVLALLERSKKIIVLTGAGVSVSCGIPDFRSSGGLYDQIQRDFGMPDPHLLFDIEYFRDDPEPFFSFSRHIYPGTFEPSISHYFIKLLEDKGKLLRNYSQNIDALEQLAGIDRLVQCHGSFATATCQECSRKVASEALKSDIFDEKVPLCETCGGVLKPDIVFFGEALPAAFAESVDIDMDQVDLLLVMGSSLKVHPISDLLDHIPSAVPQVYLNLESCRHHEFDVELLGYCDDIVQLLCEELDWTKELKQLALSRKFLDPTQLPVVESISDHQHTFKIIEQLQSSLDECHEMKSDEAEDVDQIYDEAKQLKDENLLDAELPILFDNLNDQIPDPGARIGSSNISSRSDSVSSLEEEIEAFEREISEIKMDTLFESGSYKLSEEINNNIEQGEDFDEALRNFDDALTSIDHEIP